MRRNAALVLMSLLVLMSAFGCRFFNRAKVDADTGFDPANTYVPPANHANLITDAYPSYGATEPVERAQSFDASLAAASSTPDETTIEGTRVHTVVKKDTLYGLARTYYGDQRRWKTIFEANRTTLSDPNRIRIGQKLVIP